MSLVSILGMQILLFSEVDSKKESRGWNRVGHHINYGEYKTRCYNPLLERDINYYELDFQFVPTYFLLLFRLLYRILFDVQ